MAGFLHADQDQFWKKLKSETKCLSKFQSESSSFLVWKIIQLSPEGDVNIDRDAKRRGRYLALFTDPEGDSCFSIYQISWIKLKKSNVWKSKASLSRNFVYNVQTFRGFFSTTSLRFCRKFSMKIIFYLPVNTDKPKVVAFCLYDCFIYRSNFVFRKCLGTRRHLDFGRKTVNSQGYSELREPNETNENCYSLFW